MAICVNGVKSCDGCMRCQEDETPICCPVCDTRLEYGETVYEDTGDEIVGCEYCIKALDAEERLRGDGV